MLLVPMASFAQEYSELEIGADRGPSAPDLQILNNGSATINYSSPQRCGSVELETVRVAAEFVPSLTIAWVNSVNIRTQVRVERNNFGFASCHLVSFRFNR